MLSDFIAFLQGKQTFQWEKNENATLGCSGCERVFQTLSMCYWLWKNDQYLFNWGSDLFFVTQVWHTLQSSRASHKIWNSNKNKSTVRVEGGDFYRYMWSARLSSSQRGFLIVSLLWYEKGLSLLTVIKEYPRVLTLTHERLKGPCQVLSCFKNRSVIPFSMLGNHCKGAYMRVILSSLLQDCAVPITGSGVLSDLLIPSLSFVFK